MDHGDLLQGPIDPRLLVLQRQHRSHVVWEANGKRPDDCATIVVHRSEQNLRKLPPLSQPVIQLIRQAGFGSLLDMPFMQLDLGLLTALVERWRPETHTFHFPSAEATVTLQDVEVITGLPINGRPVIGKTDLPWEQMVEQLLGCELPEEMRKGNKVSMAWLRQHFPGRVSDGATQAQIEQQARGYILHLIGGILAPDNTLHVHLCYLKLLEDLEVAGQYSWGSACLASLYRYLCRSSEAKNQDVGGMFVLLQVWAWERLPYLAPGRLGERPPRDGAALIGRWDDKFHSPDLATHVVGHYRHSLDMQRPDEVVWQPYSEELIESLPLFCRAGRAIWRAKVPLINFAIVEMHQPERVMRQFGFRQLVPPPSQARNALHGQTLKKGPQDWEVTNGAAVAMWNNRLHLVEPEGIPDLLHAYPAGDDYAVWYESITVPYVSRMSAAMAKATRLFRSLIRPDLPEEAQAIGKQGLVCMAAQEKFLRKEPPVHLVFEPEEGNEEEGEDQANFEPAVEGPIPQKEAHALGEEVVYELQAQPHAKARAQVWNVSNPISWPSDSILTRSWVLSLLNAFDWGSKYLAPSEFSLLLPIYVFGNLVSSASKILNTEPNCITIDGLGANSSVVVVGDIHGQLHDLIFLLQDAGFLAGDKVFVFNGDYVDRGAWGLETFLLLLAWKVSMPDKVYLLRGNHESKKCTSVYGFKKEVLTKYGDEGNQVYEKCIGCFKELPLASIIAGRVYTAHGGLFRCVATATSKGSKRRKTHKAEASSLALGSLEDLSKARRAVFDPPWKGSNLVPGDVLWSDPSMSLGLSLNEERGIGLLWGPDCTEEFLKKSNLKLIIRSHEGPDARDKRPGLGGMDEGYTIDHIVESGKLITLFSAPDYPQFQATGERYKNKGAYIVLVPPHFDSPVFHSFEAVTPRPEANPYYDYEDVIDSDEELDFESMG